MGMLVSSRTDIPLRPRPGAYATMKNIVQQNPYGFYNMGGQGAKLCTMVVESYIIHIVNKAAIKANLAKRVVISEDFQMVGLRFRAGENDGDDLKSISQMRFMVNRVAKKSRIRISKEAIGKICTMAYRYCRDILTTAILCLKCDNDKKCHNDKSRCLLKEHIIQSIRSLQPIHWRPCASRTDRVAAASASTCRRRSAPPP
jgi:histone H3/H4